MAAADKPLGDDSRNYHTHTRAGDLAPLCLIVGAPGRAEMIASRFFDKPRRYGNEYRGLLSYTGNYKGVPVSVTTSGMGGPSIGIVLPEAVRSGARVFIRVGSCGSLLRHSKVGDLIVVSAAIRHEGVAENWAPLGYPAVADWRVVSALHDAAKEVAPGRFHVGVECTTSDFYGGQGRPNLFGEVPPQLAARHEEVIRLGVACYSMEAANLFVWCATEGGGLPCAAVNAVFANRRTNDWGTEGEEAAAQTALEAFRTLAARADFSDYLERKRPAYPFVGGAME
ncbi:MAG: nucleoside phosphorylase [Bryobacterales bacterium]|nr:nucleoside phosphorylase [Bryobacterales bacterium]